MVEDPVIASLQAAVAAAPDDVPLRLLLARKLLDASAVDRAMAEIGAAVQRDPSSAEAQQPMREALGQPVPEPAAPVPSTVDYNWAAAEDEVREIIPPRFVENTSEQEAPAGRRAGRLPAQPKHAMTIVDLGAQVTRAVNLMQLRRPEQAETLLREVLVADATHWGALHQLAWLRWQQEEYAEATGLAERLLMLGPDRVHGHLMLARILHSQDRDAEAEPHARRALEIDPHLPQAYTVLAAILNGLDELGESWDLAEHALRLAPDYDEPYEVIIAVAGRTGGWDRAEAFALEALRQHRS